MRLCLLNSISCTLLLSTQLTTATGSVPLGLQDPNNRITARQADNLSPCVTQCFVKIFPQFDCPDLTKCICTNKRLQDALAACAVESKCSVEDLLAGKKAQAKTCGEPVRNRSMTFFVTATILFMLAIACATSRAISRGRSFGGAGYGWDDWTLFVCCLPMIGLTVCGYMEAHYGLGRDTWDLSIDNIEKCLMLFYVGNTFYAPVVFGTKIAFVLLYIRIWNDSVKFQRICYVVMALLVVALVGFEFATIFLCAPIDYTWKAIRGESGRCIHREAQLYTNSSTNVALDLVVLLLPLPKILGLKMNPRKKIGLLVTFVVGFAATGASLTQLYYLVTKLSDTQNPTWDYFDIGLWRITEMYLSIICCCMPMMAGLGMRGWKRVASWSSLPSSMHYFLEKSFGSSSSKSKNGTMGTARSGGSLSAGGGGFDDGRWQQLSAQETELGAVDSKRPFTASLETSKGYLQIADRKREIAAAKFQENAMLDRNSFAEQDFAQPQNPIVKPAMVRSGSDKSESWFKGNSKRAPRPPPLRNLRTTMTSLSPPLSPTNERPRELHRKKVSLRSWYPPESCASSDDSETLQSSPEDCTAPWHEAERSRKRWSPFDSSVRQPPRARQNSHPLRSNGMSDIYEEHHRPPLQEQTSYERRALPGIPSKAMARLGL